MPVKEIIDFRLNNPDQFILRQIKNTLWTSHNIPLSRSESTMGDKIKLIGEDERVLSIKRNLKMLLKREIRGSRLIDLGCLEGGISFEMAKESMNVTGIEGRKSNYLKCKLIEDYFKLPNLSFINEDVKELKRDKHGIFDIIICCGLLYHLDNPFSFFKTLNDISSESSILFLDTHFAPEDERFNVCILKENLSTMERFEYGGKVYFGRWYHEYDESSHEDTSSWTAISNYRSFWPTHKSLIRALYHNGFKCIYEVFGSFDIDYEYEQKEKFSRLYILAIKGIIG